MKFGTDGVRGLANVELTVADALAVSVAASRVLGARAVVIGGDTRESTPMFDAALVAGFASEGVEVHRLGVVPTPAVAFHAARLGAIGAVVSASHNPFHDNGIKLFGPGGTKLDVADERRIEAAVGTWSRGSLSATTAVGRITDLDDDHAYLDHLLGVLEGRRLDGMRIVLDAANGAAYRVAGAVFESAGAAVSVIHDVPDGRNINVACGATDTGTLQRAVLDAGADLGLALDGDADRLIAVDDAGAVVDGDHVLAICALDLHARAALDHDTVVVTVMSNLGFRLAMERAGITVHETPVGDRWVLEALDAGGCVLGGEQSGHVIFRRHATTGDGMLTGLMLADAVRRDGRPLAAMSAAAMQRLPQVLVNVAVTERRPDVAEELAEEIASARAGLGETGRILIRPSGTEPLVRVMVEATSDELAHTAAVELARVVATRFGPTG